MTTTNRFAIVSLMVVAAALPACSDATTSVRLQIVAAPSLSLERLSVTIDENRHAEQSVLAASMRELAIDAA